MEQLSLVSTKDNREVYRILNDLMNQEYQDSFLGRIEKILIEEEVEMDGIKYQIGHNERYLKLAIKAEQSCVNQIITGKVVGRLSKDILLCEI